MRSNMRRFISVILAVLMITSVAVIGTAATSAAEVKAAETKADVQVTETKADVQVAEVNAETLADGGTKTIYFSSGGYWTKFLAVYSWDDSYDNGVWKTLNKVSGEDDLYSAEISQSHDNIIFCSRSLPAQDWSMVTDQTDALVIPEGCDHLMLTGAATAIWGKYSSEPDDPVEPETSAVPTGTQTIYFAPCEEWMDLQYMLCHEFVVHAWSNTNTEGVWVHMTLAEGTYGGYPTKWSAELPAAYTNIEFCRVEGVLEDGTWNVWEKTDVQAIPADSNLFTQDENAKTGTWSYIDAPAPIAPTQPTEPPTEPEIPTEPPTEPEVPTDPVETKTVYFTPCEMWIQTIDASIGRLSAYSWSDGAEGTWTWVEVFEDAEGMYYADIPNSDSNILFGISFSEDPDSVWFQTQELAIPENSNHFTQDEDDDTIGTWSYYSKPADDTAANYYYVAFVDDDGKLIKAQVVKEGGAAVAPADPEKAADAQYTYTFAGWDTSFDVVTADTIVRAQYDKTVNTYTVTFVDKDGETIATQTVAYGAEAVAPEAPHVDGFTFTGWDIEFDYVTKDITVKATYKKTPTSVEPATTGNLKIEVAGGTGFTISIGGGAARPQGTSYYNTSAPIGAQVTVTATTTNGNEFIGWVDPANGAVLSTDLSYTFYTSGNDFIKAMYKTDVEGVNMVMFYNDRLKQQWDVQYYAATDSIVFPATDPMAAGYDFVGWNMTEAEIQAELAKGNDVTVLPVWERQLVYVTLNVTGGTVTAGTEKDGKYLANSKVTVTADAAPAGQKFAYWTVDGKVVGYDTTYSFFPKADAEVAAVFVAKDATVEYETLVEITSFTATQYGQFNFAWYVPTTQNNLTYIGAGIVAASEANYKEADFYHGTTNTSIYDRTTDTSKAIGSGYWIGPVMSGETWYAKAWVQYRDNATNEIVTVYSDLFTVTKE